MTIANKKIKILGYISMIVATIIGWKAQDIVYFLRNNVIDLDLIYFLTTITIISILLFLVPGILIYNFNKREENRDKGLYAYLGINMVVGFIISTWSLFVMIMWWG